MSHRVGRRRETLDKAIWNAHVRFVREHLAITELDQVALAEAAPRGDKDASRVRNFFKRPSTPHVVMIVYQKLRTLGERAGQNTASIVAKIAELERAEREMDTQIPPLRDGFVRIDPLKVTPFGDELAAVLVRFGLADRRKQRRIGIALARHLWHTGVTRWGRAFVESSERGGTVISNRSLPGEHDVAALYKLSEKYVDWKTPLRRQGRRS